jgi:hypothetical protein
MCGSRSSHSFDPQPVINLVENLVECKSLTSLVLSRSDIGARSSKRVMDTLKLNPLLTSVELNRCNISEQGACHIGEALPDLHHLHTLLISGIFLFIFLSIYLSFFLSI